jgi:hypothetical protein
MQGVQRQIMIAQRAGNFAHDVSGLIVKVRSSAEYFYGSEPMARDLRQQRRSEFSLYEKISG